MVDKAVHWMIILGLTYFVMSITITAPPHVQPFTIAAIFLLITSALTKPQ